MLILIILGFLPGNILTLVKFNVLIVVWSDEAFITESLAAPDNDLILSVYKMSLLNGSNSGFSLVLLILANTGKETFTCLGNNFPASILVAKSIWDKPVFALSFIFCSILPKPAVLLFTETATVPKSASTISILPKAAQEPLSSKSDNLNSFNQTSAFMFWMLELFSMAIKIPLTSPRFGLPITL